MMWTLVSDLMNEAQLRNGAFTLENDYFNLLELVLKCNKTQMVIAEQKQVKLVGPILDNAMDKFFFEDIFGDSRRFA